MIDKWLLARAELVGLEEAIDCDDPSSWTGPQWGTRLKCPVCAETYQHAGMQQHIPGRDNYEAGWGGRGDLIIIPVWCELEHVWQLCFGQHKGATFVFVRVPEQQEAAA
jgi:hypothetical protein